MSKFRPKVFLDANVVIQAGKPPGGPIMSRVADLVTANLIKVLTTDLTVTEVAKKHAENEYDVVKDVCRPHFRKIVSTHLGVSIPGVSKAELKARISKKYADSVESMFKGLKAKTLAIDDVKPSAVFTAYAEGTGFFTGEGKKDQFPDAFIFECLRAVASATSPVIVISNDGDFVVPGASVKHVTLLKTIPELFQSLGLQVKAPEIEKFLEQNAEALVGVVDKELSDWGLQVSDIEDAEIEESTVTNVELGDLISFGSIKTGDSILVVGTAEIGATVSYTHPNWDDAIYDSEEKTLIPFDNVSGETDVTLNADFSMSITVDNDGEPSEIGEFRFRNSDFQFVALRPYETYK